MKKLTSVLLLLLLFMFSTVAVSADSNKQENLFPDDMLETVLAEMRNNEEGTVESVTYVTFSGPNSRLRYMTFECEVVKSYVKPLSPPSSYHVKDAAIRLMVEAACPGRPETMNGTLYCVEKVEDKDFYVARYRGTVTCQP